MGLSSNGRSCTVPPQSAAHFHNHFVRNRGLLNNNPEMVYVRSNRGIYLNIDSSSCTQHTMSSSTRSFISSLSIDGSVANLDGSSFHLIGAPRSSDQNSSYHKRKCTGREEDGSVKCGSSGKCHCSKKRLGNAFGFVL